MSDKITFDTLLDELRQFKNKCQQAGFYFFGCLLETFPEEEKIHYQSIAFTDPEMHPLIIKQLVEGMKKEPIDSAPPQKTS